MFIPPLMNIDFVTNMAEKKNNGHKKIPFYGQQKNFDY